MTSRPLTGEGRRMELLFTEMAKTVVGAKLERSGVWFWPCGDV